MAEEIFGTKLRYVEMLNLQCPASKICELGTMLRKAERRVGPPVTDIAALKLVDANNRYDGKVIMVKNRGFYVFDAESTETEDLERIVAPTVGTGRWHAAGGQESGGGIIWERGVIDKDIVDSAGAVATEGNRYLIGGVGLNDWAGHNWDITEYTSDAEWIFTEPREGMVVHIADEDKIMIYNGTSWTDFGLVVQINRKNIAWVDKDGSDTTGQVGSFTRPYLTIGAALTAITTAAADDRFAIIVGSGEYAENVVCKPFVDLYLGTARIIPAAGDGIKFDDDMSVHDGIVSAAAGYCFDVTAVGVTSANCYNTQYAAGKVLKSGGGAFVNFYNIQPLPGAAIATFADVAGGALGGIFYDSQLDGAAGTDDEIQLYGCYCNGAWTTTDTIIANATTFVGAFSLTTPSAASHFQGCNFVASLTALEGSAIFEGCQIGTSITVNHANADIIFNGCYVGTTYTVTLGIAQFNGGGISTDVSFAGTNVNSFNGVRVGGTTTILEATLHAEGCRFVGAFLVNHANAIFVGNGNKFDDTYTVTLGEATSDGSTITGAVSLEGTNVNRFGGCTLESSLTILEATAIATGGSIEGAVTVNHANAVLESSGCHFESTYTITLGTGNIEGGRIQGATSIAGTNTNRLTSTMLAAVTVLEATVIITGSSITGALLANHANAVLRVEGTDFAGTFTVTLGVATVNGGLIVGATSLEGTNANFFEGVRFGDTFTLLEATANLAGCSVAGAVLVNHAAAILVATGSDFQNTFTVTLGEATVDGTIISGAVSVEGTNTNRLAGCTLEGALTVLEATVILAGSSVEGAVDTNHASAVLYDIGSILESTLTTTLGAAVVSGGSIRGAIDVAAGAIEMSNDTDLGGAITGAPTYLGTPIRDIGGVGLTFIRFTGVPLANDTFTIDGRIHMFDGGGDVPIVRVPGNVDGTLDNAVTAINADAAGVGVTYAIKAAGAGAANGVLIIVHETVATDFALVITVNVGGFMTASHANAVGDFVAARQDNYKFRRVMVAQDILALAAVEGIVLGCVPSTVAPRYINLFATDAAGVILPMATYRINANQVGGAWYEIELLDPLGAAQFAAGDLAYVEAQV